MAKVTLDHTPFSRYGEWRFKFWRDGVQGCVLCQMMITGGTNNIAQYTLWFKFRAAYNLLASEVT
jgi:hypothetical protein